MYYLFSIHTIRGNTPGINSTLKHFCAQILEPRKSKISPGDHKNSLQKIVGIKKSTRAAHLYTCLPSMSVALEVPARGLSSLTLLVFVSCGTMIGPVWT